MKALVFLVAALFSQLSVADDTQEIGESAAIAIVDTLNAKWADAFNARDAEALTQLFVPDGVRLPNGLPLASGHEQLYQQYQSELESIGDIELNASVLTEEVIVSNRLIIARGVSFTEINQRAAAEPHIAAGKWIAVLEQDEEGEWRYRWSTFNETRAAAK